MGLDVSCHLVVGVPCERATWHNAITKYDVDTGDPHEVQDPYRVVLIKGTNIRVDEDCDEELHLHCVDAMSDSDRFFGLVVASTSSHRMGQQNWFEVPDVSNAIAEVKKLLLAVGYHGEPRLMVYQLFSY